MPHVFNVRLIGEGALAATNDLLAEAGYGVRVQMMNAEDFEWCVALARQQPEERRIPWALNGAALDDPDGFMFSFKIQSIDDRPAGACICRFCPAAGEQLAMLNIEMLQNFRIRDSSLDGNTLRFALYVAVLFMVDTACAGLRLISPINTELADYYINYHQFVDLTGGLKQILYRDAEALFLWFQEGFLPPAS